MNEYIKEILKTKPNIMMFIILNIIIYFCFFCVGIFLFSDTDFGIQITKLAYIGLNICGTWIFYNKLQNIFVSILWIFISIIVTLILSDFFLLLLYLLMGVQV